MTMRRASTLLGVLAIVLAVWVITVSREFIFRSAQFPILLGGTLIVLALILVVLNTVVPGRVAEGLPFAKVPWLLWGFIAVLLVMYGMSAGRLGFYEITVPFVALVTLAMSRNDARPLGKKIGLAVTYAVAFTIVVYLVFEFLLGIRTPDGLLL